MSKVKQMHMKQLENDFELELSYQEWLRDTFNDPSESEINKMNEDFQKPPFASNQIISTTHLNNINYDPRKGA